LANSQDFGPLSILSQGINELEGRDANFLPDLSRSQTIFVASDYSGEHETAEYKISSFLFGDQQSLADWEIVRTAVREKFLQNREMSFKRLNDGKRRRALLPFLNAADNINGISVSIAIHKRVESLFSLRRMNLKELGLERYSHWDSSTLEKLFRIANFIGFFVAGLSRSGQNIYWITDEDAIVANETRIAEAKEICSFALKYYLDHDIGNFSCKTTALADNIIQAKDLVAIPDLVAGTLSEILSKMHLENSMPVDDKTTPLPVLTSSKGKEIIQWFADNSRPLKRFLCVIPPRSSPWRIRIIDFPTLCK